MAKSMPFDAGTPERQGLIAEADRIRAMTPGPLEDSVTLLRRDRGTFDEIGVPHEHRRSLLEPHPPILDEGWRRA